MTSINNIVEKLEEYFDSDGSLKVPMTFRRTRELKTTLRIMHDDIMLHRSPPTELSSLSTSDLREIGKMDYLLTHCFPDGNISNELDKYTQFVNRVKQMYSSTYDAILEKKLHQDKETIEKIRKGYNVLEIENPIYARSLVEIVESEEVKKHDSRIIVLYQGEQLYEENIREGIFSGLPEGSVVAFNYSPQGLMLNLETTINQSSKAKDRVEKIVIEELASDVQTKRYVDILYDRLNEEFKA